MGRHDKGSRLDLDTKNLVAAYGASYDTRECNGGPGPVAPVAPVAITIPAPV